MSLDHDDVQEILAIIDKTPAREVIVERGDLKIVIRRGGADATSVIADAPAPPLAPVASTPAGSTTLPPAPTAPPSATAIAVESPLTGTFYRAPAPGADPFVSEGQSVDDRTTLCILEVMKVMNTLKAPCAGTVVRIDAANEQAVTAGQALMWVEPA
jgi:acetyl-CoA carboxylase biotin carboxyl carrier protein